MTLLRSLLVAVVAVRTRRVIPQSLSALTMRSLQAPLCIEACVFIFISSVLLQIVDLHVRGTLQSFDLQLFLWPWPADPAFSFDVHVDAETAVVAIAGAGWIQRPS